MAAQQYPDGTDAVGRGPWTDRVVFSDVDGIAFRPGEVLTTGGDAALELARSRFADVRRDAVVGEVQRLVGRRVDPISLAADLRLAGFVAQPNHVFFAHCGGGCCCGPHPASGVAGSPVYASPVYASPVYASPVYASPVYASPVYASPVYASPVYASPVYASPVYASADAQEYRATGVRRSSAQPSDGDADLEERIKAVGAAGVKVVVLDTGLAAEGVRAQLLLDQKTVIRPAGAIDEETPDDDGDVLLDPAAGHGTFIAGLVDQVVPGCDITLHRVISNYGDGDEWKITTRLEEVARSSDERTLVNLSFGGRALDRPEAMAFAVRRVQDTGAVVVASAGNDADCRPNYPAALPGVVSVGAVGPTGPAPFTNYGPWVRACAPGVDLVSTFFNFVGAEVASTGGTDPDDFDGWAKWSGTSFAAPVVVGALARDMAANGSTAREAVARVVDAPGLMRIPNLGTLVNCL